MKLFHGSKEIIEFPKILPASIVGDFGLGFYTTHEYSQAVRWMRLSSRGHSSGFISVFNFNPHDALEVGLKVKEFVNIDLNWIRFVSRCHTDARWDHGFDVVAGPLPDDCGYCEFINFESGKIDERELLRRLLKRDFSHQRLFHTEKALKLLEFVGSRRVRLCF